jgi:hypothetical protein
MDERDMEKERKNRNRKAWGIKLKCYFLFLELYYNQEFESPEGK